MNKGPDEVVTVHTDKKIKCRRKEERLQILSEADDKIYRISFFKTIRLHNNNSVPFGYLSAD